MTFANFMVVMSVGFVAAALGFALAMWKSDGGHGSHEVTTGLGYANNLSNGPYSYSEALSRATPAVVSIYTAEVVRYIRSNPAQDWLRHLFGVRRYSQPQVEDRILPAGMGSGVIVSANGYILTNNHVVTNQRGDEVDAILIRLHDEKEYQAQVVGRDPQTDLAVLKVEAEGLPFIPMADSDLLKVGDIVFAIGNNMGVGQTTTMGIISATGRSGLGILGRDGYENFIQTDASINSGNSGGALVNAVGHLIGINTAIKSESGGNVGLGFAIPANMAEFVMTSLIETGELQRGELGLTSIDLSRKIAAKLGMSQVKGVLIDKVIRGFPAHKAGILPGDIVLAVDGKPVAKRVDFRLELSERQPGEMVKITVMRQGQVADHMVELIDLGNLRNYYQR